MIVIITGLSFIGFSQLPLNLDDWAGSYGDLALIILSENESTFLHMYVFHSDFLIEQNCYSDYCRIEIYSSFNQLVTLLGGKKPINAEFYLGINLDPAFLRNAIDINVDTQGYFVKERNETHIDEENDFCIISYKALGIKNQKTLPYIKISILIDLEEIRLLNVTKEDNSPTIFVQWGLEFLRKTSMDALIPQGLIFILLGCIILLISFVKEESKIMPVKWYVFTIVSCILLTLGNVLLHYVWYKIANMPVGWSLESPITMPPAPKPFWSKGPWSLESEFSMIPPFGHSPVPYTGPYARPVPDPEKGYTYNYIIFLLWGSYIAYGMLIIGLIMFLASLMWIWLTVNTLKAKRSKNI